MTCPKCKGTLWVCENHPDQVAHECNFCGGAGMPCECNPDAQNPPGMEIIWDITEEPDDDPY